MLSKMKLTASGCDGIPSWLLRECSYELADIVAHIVNCSVISGTVSSYWLNALVTPVPKVPKPTGFSDYRPISVTHSLVGLQKNHSPKMDFTICATRHVARSVCF